MGNPNTPGQSPDDIFKEGEHLVSEIKQSAEAQTPDVQKLNDESKKLREWSDKKEVKDVSIQKREALAKQIEDMTPTVENIAGADESAEHLKYVQENILQIQNQTRSELQAILKDVTKEGMGVVKEGVGLVSIAKNQGLGAAFEQSDSFVTKIFEFWENFISRRDIIYNKIAFMGFLGSWVGSDRIDLAKSLKSVGVKGINAPVSGDPDTQGNFEMLQGKYNTFSGAATEVVSPKDFFAKVAAKYSKKHPGETSAKYKHLEEAADEVLNEQNPPAVATTTPAAPTAPANTAAPVQGP